MFHSTSISNTVGLILFPPRERIGWAGRHDSTEQLRLGWNNLVDIGPDWFSKLVEQMDLQLKLCRERLNGLTNGQLLSKLVEQIG